MLGSLVMLILVIMLISMVLKNRKPAAQEMVEPVAPQVEASGTPASPVLLQGPPEPFIDLYEKSPDASR